MSHQFLLFEILTDYLQDQSAKLTKNKNDEDGKFHYLL